MTFNIGKFEHLYIYIYIYIYISKKTFYLSVHDTISPWLIISPTSNNVKSLLLK